MGQRGEWIPPSAPLSEGYWQALLRDGEGGEAAPTVSPADLWTGRAPDTAERSEGPADSTDAEDPWNEARNLMDREEVMELPVVGHNRGGLLVAWNGLRGFVPASHLLELPPAADEQERQRELRRFVGSKLSLKIIEVDPDNSRFVLSERATQVGETEARTLLDELEPGEVQEGRVTNLCSFGAFVDLGGFEGLVHISELSWGRVGHPSDVLDPGQKVDVYVLNVEPERERVGLSIKRLQPNPWRSVEDRYSVGQVVEGNITHVVDFGAFVQVEEGLEGLVHVSELESGKPCDPHDVLDPGDVVSVEILSIDGSRRRMGLRLESVISGAGSSSSDESEPRATTSGER